jgi:hypothetical protein
LRISPERRRSVAYPAFAGDQLHAGAGGTRDLRALARLHLDAMHRRTDRDVAQRQGVAGLDRRIAARDHLVAGLQALRRDDVAALAVDVAQQRDVRGAVRIVFDALDAGRDAFLVALEVDDAVMLLVATTDVTGGDAAVVVAAAALALLLDQRRMRRALVQVGRHHADRERRPGEVGLNFINGMGGPQALAVTSMDWPSASARTPCASRRGGLRGYGRTCSCPSR